MTSSLGAIIFGKIKDFMIYTLVIFFNKISVNLMSKEEKEGLMPQIGFCLSPQHSLLFIGISINNAILCIIYTYLKFLDYGGEKGVEGLHWLYFISIRVKLFY